MTTSDAAKSALIATIEQYIHLLVAERKITAKDAVNDIVLVEIINHLKPLGARALIKEDWDSIMFATSNIKMSSNVKKIIDEYNNQILEIMEGAKHESD
tara:strand:- start:1805 stop:2101 length:297 start_codon:yes stop_codon:yes gene_type:complete